MIALVSGVVADGADTKAVGVGSGNVGAFDVFGAAFEDCACVGDEEVVTNVCPATAVLVITLDGFDGACSAFGTCCVVDDYFCGAEVCREGTVGRTGSPASSRDDLWFLEGAATNE